MNNLFHYSILKKEVTQKVPWLKMMTSPALIVVFLCNFAAGLMASILGNYIPTYFKEALYVTLLSVSNALEQIQLLTLKLM